MIVRSIFLVGQQRYRNERILAVWIAAALLSGCGSEASPVGEGEVTARSPNREVAVRAKLILENSTAAASAASNPIGPLGGTPKRVIEMDYSRVTDKEVLVPTPAEVPVNFNLPDVITKPLNPLTLRGKEPEELDKLRATVAAVFGYIFPPELDRYNQEFQQEWWYKPVSSDLKVIRPKITKVAYENALLILRYQNENDKRTTTQKPIYEGGRGPDAPSSPPAARLPRERFSSGDGSAAQPEPDPLPPGKIRCPNGHIVNEMAADGVPALFCSVCTAPLRRE